MSPTSKAAVGWTDAQWHATLHGDPDNGSGRLLPLLVGILGDQEASSPQKGAYAFHTRTIAIENGALDNKRDQTSESVGIRRARESRGDFIWLGAA